MIESALTTLDDLKDVKPSDSGQASGATDVIRQLQIGDIADVHWPKDKPENKPESKPRFLIFDPVAEFGSVVRDDFANYHKKSHPPVYCRFVDELSDLITREFEMRGGFDLLVWNLTDPYQENLNQLLRVREKFPNLKVVMLASQEALAHSALIRNVKLSGFLMKPLQPEDLKSGIERAFADSKRQESVSRQDSSTSLSLVGTANTSRLVEEPDGSAFGLIGTSPQMRKAFALIRKVGRSNVNVLVTGESGCGKEVVANTIHRVSDRAGKPFVAINCAAIPKDLLESELFGHARGAFTGATMARRGLFEEAHEGTILLDEIGDLPLPLQAKILRLIQTRQVKPLGQNAVREVDVRIISATHKNLKAMIQTGEFREDLYYRLNVMPIHLSPLRDRREDILLLARHFLHRCADRYHGQVPSLTPAAQEKLLSLSWRGNVRELENVIERATVLCENGVITEFDIMTEDSAEAGPSADEFFRKGLSLKDLEREYIQFVLSKVGGKKEAAIRILGIDRKTLYRKERLFGFKDI